MSALRQVQGYNPLKSALVTGTNPETGQQPPQSQPTNKQQQLCIICIICVIVVVIVALVVAVVLSTGNNQIPSPPTNKTCIPMVNIESCEFRRSPAINTPCSTDSLPLDVAGYNTTDIRCDVTNVFTGGSCTVKAHSNGGDQKSCYCEMLSHTSLNYPPCYGQCNIVVTRCPVVV